MPAPVSYLDITPVPYTRVISQAEFNGGTFGAVVNQVWFRFVTATKVAFGIHATTGGTLGLQFQIYASDGSTLISGSPTRARWYPLAAGTYYVKCSNVSTGASDFDFTVDFSTAPMNPLITAPSLVINDDTDIALGVTSRPAAIIDIATGDTVGFVDRIPSGESGAVLLSGRSLWSDRYSASGAQLKLLNSSHVVVALLTPAIPFVDGPNSRLPIITTDGTLFYVLNATNGNVHTIDADGTMTQVVADIGGAHDYGAGVSRDGTIMYYAEGTAIKRWDLSTDLALSDLYTIAGATWIAFTDQNNNHGDILVMSDDSVVTNYKHNGSSTTHILHVAADGTLINNWSFSAATHAINHLSYVDFASDATGIYVWLFDVATAGDFGTLNHFDLTAGTFTPIVTTDFFSAGINLKMQGGAETDQVFGPSSSCAMLTMSASEEEPEPEPDGTPVVDISQPDCCTTPTTGAVPDPIGTFPAPIYTCEGGGQVEQVDDLPGMDGCFGTVFALSPVPLPPVLTPPPPVAEAPAPPTDVDFV